MQTQEATSRDSDAERDVLQQQVRTLQERLAFYEGFDLLIQDNVAHARELFRLAAQERETAANAVDRARREAGQQETQLRAELERIASDLNDLALAVDALSRRVTRALGTPATPNGWAVPAETLPEQPVAVVVHGVPSAQTALSL
jgi:hypothetical protein